MLLYGRCGLLLCGRCVMLLHGRGVLLLYGRCVLLLYGRCMMRSASVAALYDSLLTRLIPVLKELLVAFVMLRLCWMLVRRCRPLITGDHHGR